MRKATLINPEFTVEILPTELRYSALSDMYPGTWPMLVDGALVDVPTNLIRVRFEIFAGKRKKTIMSQDEEGNPVTQVVWLNFLAPVLFDQNEKEIPYGLYLLIEDHLNEPNLMKLAMINDQVKHFVFENSMEGFVLQVSEIK